MLHSTCSYGVVSMLSPLDHNKASTELVVEFFFLNQANIILCDRVELQSIKIYSYIIVDGRMSFYHRWSGLSHLQALRWLRVCQKKDRNRVESEL